MKLSHVVFIVAVSLAAAACGGDKQPANSPDAPSPRAAGMDGGSTTPSPGGTDASVATGDASTR